MCLVLSKGLTFHGSRVCVCVLQFVTTSDASAEAPVLSHPHPEPREAPAAGSVPAQALQLHPQPADVREPIQRH